MENTPNTPSEPEKQPEAQAPSPEPTPTPAAESTPPPPPAAQPAQATSAAGAETGSADVPKDAKTFGMLCHISALAGFIIPFGNILGPLIVWLIKKNDFEFVDDQGKEALNFQITVAIAMFVCLLLSFIVIGIPLMIVIGLAALIFVIIAAVKANDGVAYRYPFTLRLIK